MVDQAEVEDWTEWVYDTCRRFGASLGTSHKVAAVFAEGLSPTNHGTPPNGSREADHAS